MAGIVASSLMLTAAMASTSLALVSPTVALVQSTEETQDNELERSDRIPNTAPSSNLVLTTPSSFLITGRKGGFWWNKDVPPLRRNLTLRFTEPPDSVTVYVNDLKAPDGDKIYSAEHMTCEAGTAKENLSDEGKEDKDASACSPSTFEVSENGLFSMHFHFGLYLTGDNRNEWSAPPSGEFSGEILIIPNYSNNPDISQDIVIPVLLRIQDGWVLPLLILLVGVGMGMTVSAYSAGGRLSDEVTVGLNRLQTQIDRYRHDAKSFAIRAETYIADARAANQAQQLEEAQQAVNQANVVWRKWYRQRTEWDAQFAYHHQLTQDVHQELKLYQSPYLQTTSRILDDMLRNTPEDFNDPMELCNGLQEVANQVRDYGQVKIKWNQLKELVSKEFEAIAGADQKKINAEVSDIKQVFETLTPSDTEGIQALKTQLTDLIDFVKELAHTTVTPSFEATPNSLDERGEQAPKRLVSNLTMIPLPSQTPSTHEPEIASTAQGKQPVATWVKELTFWPDADGRLRTFYISSYIGSVVMLSAIGFSSLYADNLTFGADFFADYFSLVAWGFGAEATRDTVTKVVRKTDETNKE